MDGMFIYDCNLNIEGFIHMLDDPTECYKFYWLDSLLQLLSENKHVISFDDVIVGMIADAWYSVTEYHLRLGTKDMHGNSVNSIERAVIKLNELGQLDHLADRDMIVRTVKSYDKLLHDEKYQISKNVPYRLLSSFVREIGGNDALWEQRSRLIAYFEVINESRCLPYTISNDRGLDKKVVVEDRWRRFFMDNMVAIRGWIQMKKIKYLQDRNPGVPGIVYKLEPENEKQRKLQNVRKLWNSVLEVRDIVDIYSGDYLKKCNYEVDHFIPWSYISNDEIWNLVPVEGVYNSNKRDKLPEWDKYFPAFVKNQYILKEMIFAYPMILKLFENCKRDNLNSLWAMEELYIMDVQQDKFACVLSSRLKPLYEAARIQGYSVWKVK